MALNFKDVAHELSEEELVNIYKQISGPDRVTDLNDACLNEILQNIKGESVLEAGCGKGFLAKKLSEKFNVTAVDFVLDAKLVSNNPQIDFAAANLEKLPYGDGQFDTVVCTHTLEHVPDIQKAVAELRRVARERLIVVVPKQRPYKYTFDLHFHFFPYKHSLLMAMGKTNNVCKEIGGDWFYIEELPAKSASKS